MSALRQVGDGTRCWQPPLEVVKHEDPLTDTFAPQEHVIDGEDRWGLDAGQPSHRRQRALPAGHRRFRSGRQHDLVRGERDERLRGCGCFKAQIDPEPKDLSGKIPVQQLGNFASTRLGRGEPKLTADAIIPIDQGDPMTPLGGNPCHLESGGPGTHDNDMLAPWCLRRLLRTPFELPTGRRVDETRDPGVTHPPSPADLIAGNAAANLEWPAFQRLPCEIGVSDLGTNEAHHVSATGRQDCLGIGRCP